MVYEEVIQTREMSCVKLAMDISGSKKTPQGRASHITHGSDAGSTQAAVNAVIVVLEDLGLIAAS